jgi:hypothetical protein
MAMHSNKCLDVRKASKSNGAVVQQYECRGPGKDSQLWRLNPVGGGFYQIIAKHSSKCLDVKAEQWNENGATIQQWDCYGKDQINQLWRIRSAYAP